MYTFTKSLVCCVALAGLAQAQEPELDPRVVKFLAAGTATASLDTPMEPDRITPPADRTALAALFNAAADTFDWEAVQPEDVVRVENHLVTNCDGFQVEFLPSAEGLGDVVVFLQSANQEYRQRMDEEEMKNFSWFSSSFPAGEMSIAFIVPSGSTRVPAVLPSVKIHAITTSDKEVVVLRAPESDIEMRLGAPEIKYLMNQERPCPPLPQTPSKDPRVGRLRVGPATAFLIDKDKALTAGHALPASPNPSNPPQLEFNVPNSFPNGHIQFATPQNTYPLLNWRGQSSGRGRDWAAATVGKSNGKFPGDNGQKWFKVDGSKWLQIAYLSGYGCDNKMVRNYTQQTAKDNAPSTMYQSLSDPPYLIYHTGSQTGDSGSPIYNGAEKFDKQWVYAIHTDSDWVCTAKEYSLGMPIASINLKNAFAQLQKPQQGQPRLLPQLLHKPLGINLER